MMNISNKEKPKGKTYIITGFYGSGKTEFALNLAINIAKQSGERVSIADLDVINPYFRSREKAAALAPLNIEVLGSALDNNTGQDLPAISFGFISKIRRGENIILDLAGGSNGLRLLANCYDAIFAADYEFWGIFNLYRPETDNARKMIDFMRGLGNTCRLPFTGLVNNGNMLGQTSAEHVLQSQTAVIEAAAALGLPLKYTMLREDIFDEVKDKLESQSVLVFDRLQMRKAWQN